MKLLNVILTELCLFISSLYVNLRFAKSLSVNTKRWPLSTQNLPNFCSRCQSSTTTSWPSWGRSPSTSAWPFTAEVFRPFFKTRSSSIEVAALKGCLISRLGCLINSPMLNWWRHCSPQRRYKLKQLFLSTFSLIQPSYSLSATIFMNVFIG